jgi:mannose-6-phosphate isomerase-like protein (cupin superfamily)
MIADERNSNRKLMRIARRFCLMGILGVALAQQTQTPPVPQLEGFVHWNLPQYVEIHKNRQVSGTPKVSVERLGTRNGYISYYCERRLEGEYPPESHLNADEIVYIIDGEATLAYGGVQEGGTDRGGTIFGGKIVGGKTQKVHAGDMVSYPAGTPHQWIVDNPQKPETHIAIQTRKVKAQ